MNHRGGALSRGRLKARPDHSSTMLTGLLLWLCSLPLVALLILPWFGMRVALIAATVLLALMVSVCYGICAWQAPVRSGAMIHERNSRRPA